MKIYKSIAFILFSLIGVNSYANEPPSTDYKNN